MIDKRNTIPIIYNGGAYGTFLEWCLSYFSGEDVIANPLMPNGSSHNFSGHHLANIEGWDRYLGGPVFYPFVRLHPKSSKNESVVDNINKILESVDRAILLYFDAESVLLNINNKFERVWPKGWMAFNQPLFNHNLMHWGKNKLEDMEQWELRELLSLFILKQHLSEAETDSVESFNSPKLLKVNVGKELFENFESTIVSLLRWCELDLKRYNFSEVYDNWVTKQVHRNKDQLVNDIVSAVMTNQYMEWGDSNLTIVDESFIQMYLRDLHKLDLRCYNLNVFPTNTTDLRNLLFDV